jgi:hypothetical protein
LVKKQTNNYRNADGNKKNKKPIKISSGIWHVNIMSNKLKLYSSLFPSLLALRLLKKHNNHPLFKF